MLKASRFRLLLVFGTLALIIGDVTSAAQDSEGTCKKGDDCEGEMRTCMRAECVTISGEILSRMDFSVNPCDDFYLYACGGYSEKEKKNLKSVSTANKATNTDKKYENRIRLLELLESEAKDHSNAISKMKKFYKSCTNVSSSASTGKNTALRLIKRLHSWPLAADGSTLTWDGSAKWKLNDALIEAYSIGISAFLEMSMEQDPRYPEKQILQLSPKGLTLGPASNYEVKRSRDGYLKYVQTVLKLIYGEDRAAYIQEFSQKLWRFEKSLAKIFPTAAEIESKKSKSIKSLRDLQSKEKYFNFNYILNGLLNRFGITVPEDLDILVKTPKYFTALLKLIDRYAQYSPEMLSTYIVWKGIDQHIVGFGAPYEEAYNKLLNQVFLEESENHRSWYECVEKTEIIFKYALAFQYHEKYITNKDIKKIDSVFARLVSELYLLYEGADWLESEDLRDNVLDTLGSIIYLNGYPSLIEMISQVDDYYKELLITEDYVENFINQREHSINYMLRNFNASFDLKKWTISPTDSMFYYGSTKYSSEVTIPIGALIRPFYDHDYPASLLYGSLGSIMGELLINSIHVYQFSQDSEENNIPVGSLAKYESMLDCFRWQYSQLNAEIDLENDVVSGKVFEAGGLDIAYKAYLESVTGNSSKISDFSLPGLNMTGSQQFFVGFAQIKCESIEDDYIAKYLEKNMFTNQMEVNKIVQNSKEFSKVFSCPYNSAMNPKHRCSFF